MRPVPSLDCHSQEVSYSFTMFSAPPGMPTPNLYRENVPGSFLLEVAHDCRADELVEDGAYGNGSYAIIFLDHGN